MDRKFSFFALTFAITLLLIQSMANIVYAILNAALVVIALSVYLLFKKKHRQIVFSIFGVIIAIVLSVVYPMFDSLPEFPKSKIEFEATITSYSHYNNMQTGVTCDIEVMSLNNTVLDDKFTARLYANDNTLLFAPGDVISGYAKFETPVNDGEFNGFTYYKAKNIDAIAFCNDDLLSHTKAGFSIRFLPQWIAHNIDLKIAELLPERERVLSLP